MMRLASRSLFRPQVVIWLLFPAVLWWALRDIPVHEIWGMLHALSPVAMLALFILNAAILVLFTSRWWLILRAQGFRLPYLSLVGYRLAAFGVTYFTPGPQIGGEPLQVYLLQRRQSVPGATAVASVTLDKLLELFANFSFLLIGIGTILANDWFASQLRYPALLIAAGLLALPGGYLLGLWLGWLPFSRLMDRLYLRLASRKIERIREFITSSETQVGEFCKTQPWTIVQALGLSFLIWIALIFEFSLALHFLGLRLNLPEVVTILTAARIAFLLPLPAGLGALEAGQVLAMQALGLNPAFGISLSLLIRARDLALGGLGLWWGGILSR